MALDALGLVLTTRMHERVIYAETFAHGKTALETDPKSVAAQEVARSGLKSRKSWKARIHERENSMSKRPAVDLAALTSEAAAPMTEASQRVAPTRAVPAVPPPATGRQRWPTKTANLQALAFKVSPAFRKRFRQRAADADLKLNELLFEALDAWEEKRGSKIEFSFSRNSYLSGEELLFSLFHKYPFHAFPLGSTRSDRHSRVVHGSVVAKNSGRFRTRNPPKIPQLQRLSATT